MRPAELVSSHSGGLYKTPDETNGQPVGIPSAAVEWEYPQDAHDNGEYAKRDHETKSQPPSERPSWGKSLHGNPSSSRDLHATRTYVAARAPLVDDGLPRVRVDPLCGVWFPPTLPTGHVPPQREDQHTHDDDGESPDHNQEHDCTSWVVIPTLPVRTQFRIFAPWEC